MMNLFYWAWSRGDFALRVIGYMVGGTVCLTFLCLGQPILPVSYLLASLCHSTIAMNNVLWCKMLQHVLSVQSYAL